MLSRPNFDTCLESIVPWPHGMWFYTFYGRPSNLRARLMCLRHRGKRPRTLALASDAANFYTIEAEAAARIAGLTGASVTPVPPPPKVS